MKNETVAPETFEDWNLRLKSYAARISVLSVSPEKEDQEITDFAQRFPEKFLPNLKTMALDTRRSGDERILCVELLARSNFSSSLSLLAEIALAPLPTETQAARANEEMTYRAAAIEGLNKKNFFQQSQKELRQILQKTENTFLAERAQRTLKSLEGKAPTAEEQDKKMLESLLRK